MTTSTNTHSDFFHRALAAVSIIGPMLLVIAAGTMPESLETGEFVVYGHGIILAILATALVLRAAYVWGFSKAVKMAVAEPTDSVTA